MDRIQEVGESRDRSSEKPAVVPMPQEKWRHWKGQVCTIAFIDEAVHASKELEQAYLKSALWKATSAGDIAAGDTVVIYWHDAEKIWARSLQDFIAVLGDTDSIDGTMFYRFEKVPEQSIESKLTGTMNASTWASEFAKQVKENPEQAANPDFLLGWFANAIMAGWDGAVKSKADNLKSQITISLDGDVWSACVGLDLVTGAVGWAADPVSALVNLLALRSKLPAELLEAAPDLVNWDAEKISDGFHSFGELYEHRFLLFAAFADSLIDPPDQRDIPKVWKARKHHDGTNYEGWFIVGIELPVGQISYHLPDRLWDLFPAIEHELAPEWDGHSSNDVLDRLRQWIKGPLND